MLWVALLLRLKKKNENVGIKRPKEPHKGRYAALLHGIFIMCEEALISAQLTRVQTHTSESR